MDLNTKVKAVQSALPTSCCVISADLTAVHVTRRRDNERIGKADSTSAAGEPISIFDYNTYGLPLHHGAYPCDFLCVYVGIGIKLAVAVTHPSLELTKSFCLLA